MKTKENLQKLMQPVEIKTDNNVDLSIQTVTPYVYEGKIRVICPKQVCLLIEGELLIDDERFGAYSEPVLLDKEGAKQLMEELKKFIETPF
jgi:hypothetical protein